MKPANFKNRSPIQSITFRLKRLFIVIILSLASPVMTAAAPYFYTGAAVTMTLAVFEDQISDPLQRETIEARPLGALATRIGDLAGNMIPNVIYIVALLGYGLLKRDQNARDRARVMWNSSLYSVIAANLLKLAFLEPRPDGSDHFSFPSGHTASAFSFASAVGVSHHWLFG